MVVPNNALTHAGVFHADDVFATALLQILNPKIHVERANVVPDDFKGLVYDIGGGEFDHHQSGARVRENGVAYAAFGLLWDAFGTQLLCEEDASAFDGEFVQPIDLADNTGASSQLSQCVSDFNPQGIGAELAEYDAAFWGAVAWAQGVLERRINSLLAQRASTDYVRAAMSEGDGRVFILDRLVPWKPTAVGSGYVYAIYPSLRGGFSVQCVPERLGDGSMVQPFPEEWRGTTINELRATTGVLDATFCHRNGFLCSAMSSEGALKLARLSLDLQRSANNQQKE